jgi:hypothetical protein
LNTKTTDGFKAKEDEEQFTGNITPVKKAIRISFDKRPHFFRHQYLWDTNAP